MSQKQTKNTTKTTRTKTTTKSKGLGDDIEKFTTATGIKKVVDTFAELTGIDCGCDARKTKLNKLFPRRTQPLCLEEGEYTTLKQFFSDFNGNEVKDIYQEPLSRIHARVFQHKYYIPCSCNPREWSQHIADLKKIYGEYEG
eukprot:GHVU01162180.1.p2 GENE.GHVU01162180.1~~GHVU01162180.1.p2  ORF type:complete len:142 (+),score=16.96 GHVU01162180.1:39-464(+)